MTDKLVMEVSKDGWTKGLQLNISQIREDGTGHGYRIAGPKFNGSQSVLLAAELTERDAGEIRAYLDAVFPLKDAGDSEPVEERLLTRDNTIEIAEWVGGWRAGGANELVGLNLRGTVQYAHPGDTLVRDSNGKTTIRRAAAETNGSA